MALPKPIKEKVALYALQDAAESDFPDEEDNSVSHTEEKKPMIAVYNCPECGHSGMEEEFVTEEG